MYSNVGKLAIKALSEYNQEVKSKAFPVSGTHTYPMADGEEEQWKDWMAAIATKETVGV